jgi:hypothetical protein
LLGTKVSLRTSRVFTRPAAKAILVAGFFVALARRAAVAGDRDFLSNTANAADEKRYSLDLKGRYVEECLAYFRQAVVDPLSVVPWSEWWAANTELVERIFPRHDFVRLKHRRLRGAREILQRAGVLPEHYKPPHVLRTGSCSECGERTTNHFAGPGGGRVTCPNCGLICVYDCRTELDTGSQMT